MRRLNSAPQACPSEGALAFLPRRRGRPSLPDLIVRAVCVSASRKGASLAAIKKALLAGGYDVQKNNGRLKAALSSLVARGILQRVTGSGLTGSFRMNKTQQKGGAVKKTKKKPALKRARPQIAARRSLKKINLVLARRAGRETKPPAKRPKGRGATRGQAAVKRR